MMGARMKGGLLLLMLALALAFAGCDAGPAEVETGDEGSGTGEVVTSGQPSTPAAEAMPATGPGESAALAALPEATDQLHKLSSLVWPDLTGVEPALVAYLIAVDMGDQTALFEVRADGIAHSLYAYQKAFDAGTIVWTPTAQSLSVRSGAQSDPERAAVAAVETAMRDAFPDAALAAAVYGYRFEYAKAGAKLIAIEIAADGSPISAGN
jgi:hypothetical protein